LADPDPGNGRTPTTTADSSPIQARWIWTRQSIKIKLPQQTAYAKDAVTGIVPGLGDDFRRDT
jgi:hypothetical protein